MVLGLESGLYMNAMQAWSDSLPAHSINHRLL